MKKVNIAIDGPSGAGKSSLAKALAKKLNYTFINTGSFYRALAYVMNKKAITVEELIKDIEEIKFDYLSDDEFFVNGELISGILQSDSISQLASNISQYPEIRKYINKYIINLVKTKKGFILEGRDTTYRLAPNAEIRIYLDAPIKDRAMRRHLQYLEAGIESDLAQVLEDVEKRDFRDINRKTDPLQIVEGVTVFRNSGVNFDESVNQIIEMVKNVKS
ncbi:cytidylate kinase [Mycoplasma testudineum]|uniref:Cytidylate kinase n=1 Tax=Mycoplasma testudineum TaxID=244584 RepID=A0A4R6IC55_9MOLU|nr:(d)CMP kinase [Mycoplasma testudineum]OYD26581.1 cytidylate kinase [Mycoplasma testudineum]TDO19414.1 cytidylate kinase [Mycoplasma testudineum]